MSFRLSDRSTGKLDKVDSNLVALVKMAILKTKVDFGVICGLRTIQEQKLLVDKGVSQTMDSKHISGSAVDLMAYVGSRASWELNLYDDIADSMKKASKLVGVPIRWGAASYACPHNGGKHPDKSLQFFYYETLLLYLDRSLEWYHIIYVGAIFRCNLCSVCNL